MRLAVCLALLLAIAVMQPAPAAGTEARIGELALDAPPGHARALAALAERARVVMPALEAHLGARVAGPWRMRLIPPGKLLDPELIRLDGAAPRWAAGFVIPARRIGAIRMAEAARYPYGSLESVLAHEAAHMLLHDATGGRLPRWFNEGLATWEGRRWSLEDVLVYSTALIRDDVPPLEDLDGAFDASAASAREAYAVSFSFVSWTLRTWGDGTVRDLLGECRRRPFGAAWRGVTGMSLREAEREWRRESLSRVRWLVLMLVSNVLWIGITLLALAAGIVRRVRAHRARAAWPDEPAPGEGDPGAPAAGGPL